jgi:subtilisin family serine protease
MEDRRRFLPSASSTAQYVPGVVNVTYNRSQYMARSSTLSAHAVTAGAQLANQLDLAAINRVTQILRVTPGTEAAVMAKLKQDPAVVSVGRSAYRHLESSTPAYTNDPYENGFAPSNTPPLYEGSSSPGQWDLHVVCAPNAWGYGTASNGTGSAHAGAAGGSSGVPIAIIDTGADLTHPELQPVSRIAWAEAETSGHGTVTSTGVGSMHDNDGHGTNVAGIAAATANNGLGFAGVAYNAPLMIFKVFPDCPANSTNCTASSADIATAITDAVSKGAKVISMSLGADTPAGDEESAVANAIAQNVIVVAASGNGNSNTGLANSSLSYPAADPGVIAVGASAIDDTNPAAPVLKVASYSNYSGANPGSWGVVAPGGDACPGTPEGGNCSDNDDLHWIENIYSSTATSPGDCSPDFGNPGGATDCRILIIGTSQATPHVTGAVALLLSVGVAQNPTTVKNLLCDSATAIQSSSTNASHQGCGELDVYRAMAAALGDSSP